MRAVSRVFTAAALAAILVLPIAACAGVPNRPAPSASDNDAQVGQAKSDTALSAYVAAERASIPTILKRYPGLYSEVNIDGARKDSSGKSGIPKGKYSVVVYSYVYAQTRDWAKAIPLLDTQKSVIDGLCTNQIFPAMRSAGVTGPMGATYAYGDAANGTKWSYSCSAQS